jgi:hypothetical protein
MSRRSRARGTSKGPLFAALAILLVSGLLSANPSAAHTFTKNDGDDSPSRLDIRSASVEHRGNSVVHSVRTYEGWTVKSLGKDSFLVVEIDKNFDNDFEQCAFIFFAGGRLRGSLTNCGQTFLRRLPVSKPSKATARVTIPTAITGTAYRWVVFSFWTGPPARCSDLCFDAAPNRPPPILHDLTRPEVTMDTSVIDVWEDSDTTTFAFPFTTSDVPAGVESWTIQKRPLGDSAWIEVLSGTGGGSEAPSIDGVEGERANYRVVATDKQGNRGVGPMRQVNVPLDQDSPSFSGSYPGSTPVVQNSIDAFGGSFVELDAGETFAYDASFTVGGPTDCKFVLIGPRTGTWSVDIEINNVFHSTITSDGTGGHREVLSSDGVCDTSIEFTVMTGAGFGVDAVVI